MHHSSQALLKHAEQRSRELLHEAERQRSVRAAAPRFKTTLALWLRGVAERLEPAAKLEQPYRREPVS